jgi:hypothetical protein
MDSPESYTKRAIEDYSQFAQHLRSSVQFVFAANGGAVIAMLSCLTAVCTAKDVTNAIQVAILIHRFAGKVEATLACGSQPHLR